MSSKLPEPMSEDELRALPPVLDFATAARGLRMTYATARKRVSAGTFPLTPLPHSDRRRLYARADLLAYLSMDPAPAATPPASPASAA